MATVKKSKSKYIVIPIIIVLVIAIIVGSVFAIKSNQGVETVTLTTIKTDGIVENVSATGEVSSGAIREYKINSVATCKEVFVKVGDRVKKGDVLATFDTENLDSEIKSLQETYNTSAKAYTDAVASQKAAQAKLDSVNKQIPVLEKKLAEAKKAAQNMTTTKSSTKKNTTQKVEASNKSVDTPALYAEGEGSEGGPSYDPSLAGLVEAIGDLVETINGLTQDIEDTNELTRIVLNTILTELENGTFDSEEIGKAVGEAVAKAIQDGIVEVVDSGAAVEMIETAVASVDWAAVGTGIGETNSVQLASVEVQLAALYAQKELFTAQADPSIVHAQKQVRDNSKQALDTLKKTQAELQAGWTASMNGIITECNVVAGAQTTMLETGMKLENQKTMAVTISLGEYDVHKVKVGMPATIKTAYGQYSGEIATIAPTATGGSQGSILDSVGSMAGISGLSSLTDQGAGVKCTITVNEPDENIIPGFDASVDILVGDYEGIPVVPIESMVREKEGTFVYLYDEAEGTATKTKIETGAISDTAYEIKSGLAVGDQIIATPGTYEEDTFKVKIATKK